CAATPREAPAPPTPPLGRRSARPDGAPRPPGLPESASSRPPAPPALRCTDARSLGGAAFVSGLGLGRLLGRGCRLALVLLPEPLHATLGVHQLVLAGEERVAGRADLHVERAAGAAGLDDVAAGTGDARGRVDRVKVGLHGAYASSVGPPCPGRPHVPGGLAGEEQAPLTATRGRLKPPGYFFPLEGGDFFKEVRPFCASLASADRG